MALSDLHVSKVGVAALVATLVKTIAENDPTFEDGFLKNLTEADYKLKDDFDIEGGNIVPALEVLRWTREFITGFSPFTGQGEPLLGRDEADD